MYIMAIHHEISRSRHQKNILYFGHCLNCVGGGLLAQIDFDAFLKIIMMLASKESERQNRLETKLNKGFLKVGRGVCVYPYAIEH